MKSANIFEMKQSGLVLLNHFNELYKLNLVSIDKKVDIFRIMIKSIIEMNAKNHIKNINYSNRVRNKVNEGEIRKKKPTVKKIENIEIKNS